MKHLLNDMSSEEKNSIREQHAGGIQIDTTKFKTLLETKLGDARPLVNEEEDDAGTVVDETKIDSEGSTQTEEQSKAARKHLLANLFSSNNDCDNFVDDNELDYLMENEYEEEGK